VLKVRNERTVLCPHLEFLDVVLLNPRHTGVRNHQGPGTRPPSAARFTER